jgi:hypothetical protein
MNYAVEVTSDDMIMYIKSHDDRFWQSNTVKGNISTICEAIVR